MTALALVWLLLAGRAEIAIAARYGDVGDRWDNGALACSTATAQQVELGFAHRTGRCLTPALICARRCAVGWLVDRGPVGALDRKGRWHARPHGLRDGERYRGSLDLRPALAKAVGVRGVEAVAVMWLDNERN